MNRTTNPFDRIPDEQKAKHCFAATLAIDTIPVCNAALQMVSVYNITSADMVRSTFADVVYEDGRCRLKVYTNDDDFSVTFYNTYGYQEN